MDGLTYIDYVCVNYCSDDDSQNLFSKPIATSIWGDLGGERGTFLAWKTMGYNTPQIMLMLGHYNFLKSWITLQ